MKSTYQVTDLCSQQLKSKTSNTKTRNLYCQSFKVTLASLFIPMFFFMQVSCVKRKSGTNLASSEPEPTNPLRECLLTGGNKVELVTLTEMKQFNVFLSEGYVRNLIRSNAIFPQINFAITLYSADFQIRQATREFIAVSQSELSTVGLRQVATAMTKLHMANTVGFVDDKATDDQKSNRLVVLDSRIKELVGASVRSGFSLLSNYLKDATNGAVCASTSDVESYLHNPINLEMNCALAGALELLTEALFKDTRIKEINQKFKDDIKSGKRFTGPERRAVLDSVISVLNVVAAERKVSPEVIRMIFKNLEI